MPTRGESERELTVGTEPQAKARQRHRLWVITAVLASALLIAFAAYVVYQNAAPTIRRVSFEELDQNRAAYIGRKIDLSGRLAPGTLVSPESCVYRFLLEAQDGGIPVRYAQCVTPDTFRHQLHTDFPITARGKLVADGHFEAETLLMRTPGPYRMVPVRDPRSDLPSWLNDAGSGAPDSAP